MFTILTIDDEENIRNGLADNFELEGYNVEKPLTEKKVLQKLQRVELTLL